MLKRYSYQFQINILNFFEQITFSLISFISSLAIVFFWNLSTFGDYVFYSIFIYITNGLIDSLLIKSIIDNNKYDTGFLSGCLIYLIISLLLINLIVFIIFLFFFKLSLLSVILLNISSSFILFLRVINILNEKIKYLIKINLVTILLRVFFLYVLSKHTKDLYLLFTSFFVIDIMIIAGLIFKYKILIKQISINNLIYSVNINKKNNKIYFFNNILDLFSSNLFMWISAIYINQLFLGAYRVITQIFGLTSIFYQYIDKYHILDFKKNFLNKYTKINLSQIIKIYKYEILIFLVILLIILITILLINYWQYDHLFVVYLISIPYCINVIFTLICKYLLVPIRASNKIYFIKNIINISPILIIVLTPTLIFYGVFAVPLILIIPPLISLIFLAYKLKLLNLN